MAFEFVLLIIPTFGLAKMNVHLTGVIKQDGSDLKVTFDGNGDSLISNTDRDAFHLSDNNIKNIVYLDVGKRPDNFALRSPTLWGDIYKEYGWYQIFRTLKPESGLIMKSSSGPVVIYQQLFENKNAKRAIFSAGISKDFQNTISSYWEKEGKFSANEEISYDIELKVDKDSKNISYSYTSTYGEKTKRSENVTVGSETPIELVLESGQSVISQLNVTTGNIRFRVGYHISLNGHIVAYYAYSYKGHSFFISDIQSGMRKASIKNWKQSLEFIDYKFYANSSVVVRDNNTGKKIFELPLLVN